MAGSLGKKIGAIGLSLLALIVATIVFSQACRHDRPPRPVRHSLLTLASRFLHLRRTGARRGSEYSEELPTKRVGAEPRNCSCASAPALPAPAARRVDAIGGDPAAAGKPVAEIDPLDPCARMRGG
jgi:hypothetical protein